MRNRQAPRRGNRSAFGAKKQSSGFRRNGRVQSFNKKGPKKAYIDPKRFVKKAKPLQQTTYVSDNSYENLKVHQGLKNNLLQNGIKKPTKIQDQAIPHAMSGKDLVGLANTGTGKTMAFLIPTINKLLTNRAKKAIVIAPTRELAQQIQEEARRISKGLGIYDALLIGGVNIKPQLRDLSRNHHLVIGTPGRIMDHLERGSLQLHDSDIAVLDEVDRMLDMGFVNDIRSILSSTPDDRQSLFFSATMQPQIESLIGQFSSDPIKIQATTGNTSDNVEQDVQYYGHKDEKIDLLHDLLIGEGVGKTLIFCDTKRFSDRLSRDLRERGFKSDAIHGDKSQNQRKRALDKLKKDEISILVATDVAARGIDVDGITHVINYDTPGSYEDYTHRIGRTGRSNTTGFAITFVEK
ncbi:MAG: DEAD/DEAH box helicase [Patescibacteria group bacterium]